MGETKMEAAIFFDSYLPDALQRALDYAGQDGFVASLPQLLHARVRAPYDNEVWCQWFTPNSEESVIRTPQGNHVMITVHGGGIFGSADRFELLFRSDTNRFCKTSFTGLFAGKLTDREESSILNGKLTDGTEFPVYPYAEFQQGMADLPRRYGVVMDFAMARRCHNGYTGFDALKDDPLMIVRAGGAGAAHTYLDVAQRRNDTDKMGSWHPFNSIKDIDQAQAYVPDLAGNTGGRGSAENDFHLYGKDSDYGIGADGDIHSTSMIDVARYIAVAPRDESTSVRNLSFNRD